MLIDSFCVSGIVLRALHVSVCLVQRENQTLYGRKMLFLACQLRKRRHRKVKSACPRLHSCSWPGQQLSTGQMLEESPLCVVCCSQLLLKVMSKQTSSSRGLTFTRTCANVQVASSEFLWWCVWSMKLGQEFLKKGVYKDKGSGIITGRVR